MNRSQLASREGGASAAAGGAPFPFLFSSAITERNIAITLA